MATVVLDSTNMEAVLADAVGEEAIPLPVNDNAAAKASEPEKVEAAKADPDADDVEGEDGLTPRQKRDFTASMLKTIGKKHARIKEAEEFAAAQYTEKQLAEQRARDLGEENARLKEQLQPKVVEAIEPKRDGFETEEAYQNALMDWKVDQRFKAREAESAKAAEDARQASVVAAAKARIAHAIEVVPDYAAVTGAIDLEVPAYVAVAMQESDLFAEIGYYFGQHSEELAAIQKMTPTKALLALGKIEAKLQPFAASTAAKAEPDGITPSPKTEPIVPSRPRASAPITPLSSASSVQVVKDEAAMNVREVITDWSRKNKVNLGRRQRH